MVQYELGEYISKKEFGAGETLPEGDTFFDIAKTKVEEIETEWEGKKRMRFKLTCNGKSYFVGSRVMEGIKVASNKGFDRVRVTRAGLDKNTTYTCVGVKQ